MRKPEPTPLDPTTPRSKKVTPIPMPKLYPEAMSDDVYYLDQINKKLDEISNENNSENN